MAVGVNARARGWVYFAASDFADAVKIGFSERPEERVRAIDCHSAVPVRLVWMFKTTGSMELKLHRRFAPFRERYEWFRFAREIRDYIDELSRAGVGCAGRPIDVWRPVTRQRRNESRCNNARFEVAPNAHVATLCRKDGEP